MLIAIKYNEDDYFANEFYAKVGGVSKSEIDRLEYAFLNLSQFNLFVNEEVFDKYNSYLISCHDEEEEQNEEEEDDNNSCEENLNREPVLRCQMKKILFMCKLRSFILYDIICQRCSVKVINLY